MKKYGELILQALNSLFDIVKTLPVKAKVFFVFSVIFLGAAYLFFDRWLDYKEAANPSKDEWREEWRNTRELTNNEPIQKANTYNK